MTAAIDQTERNDEAVTVLTPAEAADLMRITTGTLANHRCKGTGPPFVKFGATVRYFREDVLAYLRGNRVTSTD